jgi:hypothetical protein
MQKKAGQNARLGLIANQLGADGAEVLRVCLASSSSSSGDELSHSGNYRLLNLDTKELQIIVESFTSEEIVGRYEKLCRELYL